jgi:tetratricopeptide (TPR) repeat protein
MRNFENDIQQLQTFWDAPAAGAIVRDLVTTVWQAGGPDEQTQRHASAIRELVSARLAACPSPAEQLELLNVAYALEQGIGNRDQALPLAERAEQQSRSAGSKLDRVRAIFQLAKALLYVNRNADAVEWTRQGLRLGDELDRAAELAEPDRLSLRRLLAGQESRQVNRLATLGGNNDEVDRLAESVVNRWSQLNDPRGLAAGLGMLVEARVFHGRWAEAAALARKACAAVGYPPKLDAGIAYSLCFGGLALCRLGEAETALQWTTDAETISHGVGNHECVMESRAVHAVALAALGRVDEAIAQIDGVIKDSESLHMEILTRWVIELRGWIKLKPGLPVSPEELLEAYEYSAGHGYHAMAAEMLYAAALALRAAGCEYRKQLDEAVAQFERFGMTWHLSLARRGAYA